MNIKKHTSAVLSVVLIVALVFIISVPIFAEETVDSLLAEGWRYFNGDGVPQDQVKGIGLMVDAANAGSDDLPETADCSISLGNQILSGTGLCHTRRYQMLL